MQKLLFELNIYMVNLLLFFILLYVMALQFPIKECIE